MRIGVVLLLLTLPLCAQEAKQQTKATTAAKSPNLSGAWMIDGLRKDLKLDSEKSTATNALYCDASKDQQTCAWVDKDGTLHVQGYSAGIPVLFCTAPYTATEDKEMTGPCEFGNPTFGGRTMPTPKGLNAKRIPTNAQQQAPPATAAKPTTNPPSSVNAQAAKQQTKAAATAKSANADPEAVARTMASSLNVFRYPRSPSGTKYGLTYIVTLASGGGGGFAGALQLPDAVVAPVVDFNEKEPFKAEWPKEMVRLGLSGGARLPLEVNAATAMMKDVDSRQEEYLARAKMLTPELMTQWNAAAKFNGGVLSKSALAMLMIQHDALFKGAAVQESVSQNELNQLLSIPQECADSWAATVSSSYKPIDAAFSLLQIPELFSGGTFNRSLFDQALPLAAKLIAGTPAASVPTESFPSSPVAVAKPGPDSSSPQVLITLFLSDPFRDTLRDLEKLGERFDESILVPFLEPGRASRDRERVRSIVHYIQRTSGTSDKEKRRAFVPGLVSLLPNQDFRRDIVGILGDIGDARAIDPLLDVLKDSQIEEDLFDRTSLSLAQLGHVHAVLVARSLGDVVLALVRSHSRVHYLECVHLSRLGVIEQESCNEQKRWLEWWKTNEKEHGLVQSLIALLPYPHISQYAISGLGEIGDKSAVEPLLYQLANGASAEIRGLAAQSLGKLGDRRAVPPLLAIRAKNQNSPEEYGACDALYQIMKLSQETCLYEPRWLAWWAQNRDNPSFR